MAGPTETIILNGAENTLRSKILANIERGTLSWKTIDEFKAKIPENQDTANRLKMINEVEAQSISEWESLAKDIMGEEFKYTPEAIGEIDKYVNELDKTGELNEEISNRKLALNNINSRLKRLSDTKEEATKEQEKVESVRKIIDSVEREKVSLCLENKGVQLNDNTPAGQLRAGALLEEFFKLDENKTQSQTVSSPNQNTNPYVDRNINPAQNFNLNNNSIIFSNDNNVPVRTKKKSYSNVEFEYPEDWSMESNPDGSDVLKDSQGKEVATITKDGNGEIKNINMNFENGGCVIVNGKPLNIPPGSQMKMKITSDGVKYNVINRAGESIMNGTINKNGEYVGPHVDMTHANRLRHTYNQPFSSPDSDLRQSQYRNTTLNSDSREENLNRIELENIAERTINLNPEIAARNDLTNNVGNRQQGQPV